MTDPEHAKTVERVEDLRRDYCPADDPLTQERIEDHDTPGRMDPDSQWEQDMEDRAAGPEAGRCGSCGEFVEGGAIICRDCDVSERRREFEAGLP